MYGLIRPLLFSLPPDAAHELAMTVLGAAEHVPAMAGLLGLAVGAAGATRDERLRVDAMGLTFPSPIGLAGGFDKNARRPRALAALGFGHLELGTVTARAQDANPRPHLFRLKEDRALVNRLGFPNEGAERVARRWAAARVGVRVPVGLSIGKSRVVDPADLDAVVADYLAAFDAVRPVADFVVVNVSSPNTAGLRTMQARDHARELLGAIRRRDPAARVLVKIAPDLDDAQLEDVLAVAAEVGLSGVVATNTTIAREGLRTPRARIEAIGAGGLSGAPIRARAVSVVRRVRARLGRPFVVVGVGGVETADHALALIRAGADLVQMYTGFVYEGPGAPARIARGIARALERDGASHVAQIVGVDAAPGHA